MFHFAMSPSGQFVYSFGYASGGSSTVAPIESYQMDAASGALTAVSGSAFGSLPTVVNCFFDQSGAIVLCGDTLAVGNFMRFRWRQEEGTKGRIFDSCAVGT